MLTFVLRRLLALPPLLLAISFLTYLLLQAAPGDFYTAREADPKSSQDSVMEMRRSAGKVRAVAPADRARSIGQFPGGPHTFAFDGAGQLLKDGAPADPRAEQQWVRK